MSILVILGQTTQE